MDNQVTLIVTAVATGAGLVAAGWLLLHLARRAAAGTLKRNQFAGIRTSVTLSSDAAWRAAHLAAEKDSIRGARGLIVGGVLSAVSGLLGFIELVTRS
ncbi:SdpI family protein [Streptomyces clavifer]|uniref:SdpI family protein n=1 Tax=Streptomyces clavifer TaxID=68188 RepID=UPI00308505B1|nr:SdpI family protein [Streptomyces clavifer]WRY86275.1 SdpI family protein [Streptomyces clavifer]